MHVLSVLPSCVRYALVAAIGCTLSISAVAQLSGAPTPIGRSTSSFGNTMSNPTTVESIPAPTVAAPNTSPFAGSVASGKPTDEVLRLSIRDAIDRGLRYNLGVVQIGRA